METIQMTRQMTYLSLKRNKPRRDWGSKIKFNTNNAHREENNLCINRRMGREESRAMEMLGGQQYDP
jgi:hypothetical protein